MGGETQAREFVAPADAKENGPVDSYTFPEKRLQQASESENILEENSVEKPNGSLKNTASNAQDRQPASVEEPAREPQKHTYASIVCTIHGSYVDSINSTYMHKMCICSIWDSSIYRRLNFLFLFPKLYWKLRVAKGQSATSVTPQPSVNKNVPPASEWNHTSQAPVQQSTVMSDSFERPEAETAEEIHEGYIWALPLHFITLTQWLIFPINHATFNIYNNLIELIMTLTGTSIFIYILELESDFLKFLEHSNWFFFCSGVGGCVNHFQMK